VGWAKHPYFPEKNPRPNDPICLRGEAEARGGISDFSPAHPLSRSGRKPSATFPSTAVAFMKKKLLAFFPPFLGPCGAALGTAAEGPKLGAFQLGF